jgi:hypothetical protein
MAFIKKKKKEEEEMRGKGRGRRRRRRKKKKMEEKKKQQNKFCVACYKFLNLVNSNFTFSNEIYQYNAQRKSSLTYFLSILKFILQIHRSQLSNCQSCKRN